MSDADPDDLAFAPTRPGPVGPLPDPGSDTETIGAPPSAGPYEDTTPVPGYEIHEVLGRGGMGIVYKARQTSLNRVVALKMVLSGARAEPVERHRFMVEAEAVAAIRHPNVVNVFAYGDDNGRPYLALEYLSGGNLATRLRDGPPLVPAATAALVEKIARGVHAAHLMGIVHRDLKSANVLFDDSGEPKVTDFGLAKRSGSSDVTRTGAVMGTPAYMAPEQAKGEFKFVGPAADVWALGVILYECLTGTMPFRGDDSWGVLAQVMADEPAPPRKVTPGVPRDMEVICLKCLSKSPIDRYTSAESMADDLKRCLAGEPIEARPASRVERLLRWTRRKPAQAGFVATAAGLVLVGLIAAGAVYALVQINTSNNNLTLALGTAQEATEGERKARELEGAARKEAVDARDKLEHISAINRVVLAHRDWQAGNVLSALQELNNVPPARREWEWDYVHRLCNGEAKRTDFPRTVSPISFAVSRDGKHAALAVSLNKEGSAGKDAEVDHYELRVLELDTGRVAGVIPMPGLASHLEFDPTGRWIATVSLAATKEQPEEVVVWDWARRVRVAGIPNAKAVYLTEFDPLVPGRLYVRGFFTPLTAWQVEEGRPPKKVATFLPPALEDERHALTLFKVSPDGKQIVAIGLNGMYAWNPADPTRVVRKEFDTASFNPLQITGILQIQIALNRDGSMAAIGQQDGSIVVLRTADGTKLARITNEASAVAHAAFDAAGRLVTVGSTDTVIRIWDPLTGQLLDTLRGHTGTIQGLGIRTGSGELLTTALDHTLRVWPAAGTAESRTVKLKSSVGVGAFQLNPAAPVWTPDFSTLATWDYSAQSLSVWDTVAGTQKGPAVPWMVIKAMQDPKEAEKPFEFATVLPPFTFHPDGTLTAAAVDNTTKPSATLRIYQYNILTLTHPRRVREIPLSDPHGSRPRFSADGKRLVIETGRTDGYAKFDDPPPVEDRVVVKVFDVDTGKELFSTGRLEHRVNRIHLTPDGRRVVVRFLDETIRGWKVDSGEEAFPEREVRTSVNLHVRSMGLDQFTFSPDGRYTASLFGSTTWTTIQVFDLENNTTSTWPSNHAGNILGYAFRPDSRRLLTFGSDRRIRVWDLATMTATLTLSSAENISGAAFSGDGRKILAWQNLGDKNPSAIIFESELPKK